MKPNIYKNLRKLSVNATDLHVITFFYFMTCSLWLAVCPRFYEMDYANLNNVSFLMHCCYGGCKVEHVYK